MSTADEHHRALVAGVRALLRNDAVPSDTCAARAALAIAAASAVHPALLGRLCLTDHAHACVRTLRDWLQGVTGVVAGQQLFDCVAACAGDAVAAARSGTADGMALMRAAVHVCTEANSALALYAALDAAPQEARPDAPSAKRAHAAEPVPPPTPLGAATLALLRLPPELHRAPAHAPLVGDSAFLCVLYSGRYAADMALPENAPLSVRVPRAGSRRTGHIATGERGVYDLRGLLAVRTAGLAATRALVVALATSGDLHTIEHGRDYVLVQYTGADPAQLVCGVPRPCEEAREEGWHEHEHVYAPLGWHGAATTPLGWVQRLRRACTCARAGRVDVYLVASLVEPQLFVFIPPTADDDAAVAVDGTCTAMPRDADAPARA